MRSSLRAGRARTVFFRTITERPLPVVNFFEQQAVARKRTTLCVALYGVAVAAVTVCVVPIMVLGVLYLSLALERKSERGKVAGRVIGDFFNDPVGTFSHGPNLAVLIVAVIATLTLIFGASFIRYVSLRRGGSAVAEGLGAKRVSPNTTDRDERRLLNVVEEMALASSVPVPTVYVMENEDGVNAFAAGHSPSDAAVAVTRGTLRRLNREQLQGVVAHEFSHILNGDMRLNLRLMGLLYGILCVGLLGQVLLRTGSDRKNPLPFVGLLLIVIGAAGGFCARMIKAMISRQREYLADASAVQFTRNPSGIGGALRVIGGTSRHGRLNSSKASECSHMMFVSCVSGWLESAMATHPPLEDRIRRVDPQWDGTFLPGREYAPADTSSAAASAADYAGLSGEYAGSAYAFQPAYPNAGGPSAVGHVAAAMGAAYESGQRPSRLAARRDLSFAGGLSAEQVFARIESARASLSAIPPRLIEASREPFTARALLLGMLLDQDEAIRGIQLRAVTDHLGDATAQNTRRVADKFLSADQSIRLPLIDLSIATLAGLSLEQYKSFRRAVTAVILADNRVDLFELCLEQLLIKHLDHRLLDARPVPVQYYALHRLGPQVETLLRAVAAADKTASPDAVDRNITAALKDLRLAPDPAASCDLPTESIIAAFETMRSVTPRLRARVLAACATIVGADGRVDPQESELLRAIADTLDLPLAMPEPLKT